MKRIQTWFLNLKDRPLLQAAIGAVFLGLLLLYMLFPVPFPSTYTEEEITIHSASGCSTNGKNLTILSVF